MSGPAILWFRQDLRLADNPALVAASAGGRPVLALYVLDEQEIGDWAPGGASRWWLHQALVSLEEGLRARGASLLLRRGPARDIVPALAQEVGASSVHWNRLYEPDAIRRDAAIKQTLKDRGVTVESHNGSLLFEPWTVVGKSGEPLKVFSPFWRACQALPEPGRPLPAPDRIAQPAVQPRGERLADWALLPTAPDWAGGLRDAWTVSEAGAAARLDEFIATALADYQDGRNLPDRDGSSRLSPFLRSGQISPRQVWHAIRAAETAHRLPARSVEAYLRELGWREFSYHLLFQFPDLPNRNFRTDFDAFPWAEDADLLRAWQRGRTGYPIVDAGMRQLWQTGWMHNRVRMIAASLLVKHLLQPWQQGARWFWDTLVDADLANNSASWQWVAGSGADAAPYFRIFNPVLQGEKFDAAGDYVRRYVPELARLPAAWIHKPWDTPPDVLMQAGLRLGRDYPRPVIDHAAGRQRALAAFATIGKTVA